MTSPIQLCNTLTGAKEPLRTERTDRVTIYVYGPAVYDYAYIGNAHQSATLHKSRLHAREHGGCPRRLVRSERFEGCAISPTPSRTLTLRLI